MLSYGCTKLQVKTFHFPSSSRHHRLRIHPTRPLPCTKEERSEIVKDQEEDEMYFGGLFEKGGDPRLYGESVDPDVPLPTEYDSDFWESPGFGFIGKAMGYFVPVIIALALVVGGIAAKSFNEGATSYLTPATKDNDGNVEIVPIEETK